MLCPLCGKEIPEAYAGVRCPSCGGSLTADAAGGGGPVPPTPPVPSGIPWENRTRLGFFPALLQNIRSCLFDPDTFFGKMPKRDNLGAALIYVALLGWFGTLGGFFWSLVLRAPQMALMRSMGIEPKSQALPPAVAAAFSVCVLLLAPLFIVIAVFIWSAILHVCLWIFGGAREGFEATTRVVSYAAGSTYPFQLIPLCGGLVGGIWSLVLQIIGLSKAHGITPGRAAVAVLFPLALCCVLMVIGIALFAGALVAALKGGGA
jgi:hypothetical protein